MYSFYNDDINDEIYKRTNELLSEKDLQLTELIFNTFEQSVRNSTPLRFNEFERSFNNIYSFSTNQKGQMYSAYRNQRDKNRTEAEEVFESRGQEKVNDYTDDKTSIFTTFNNQLQEFLKSLLLTSWTKLNNMVNEYDSRVSQLPQIGEEI